MRLYFASIFDINYLSRGLTLYESIRKWHNDFVLFVVCLDEEVKRYFLVNTLDGIELITISEIEENYQELLEVKNIRSYIDYVFTLSPYYPSFILKKNPSIPFICSLDCDQYFFNNSEFVFQGLENHSVLVMPHRFTEQVKHHSIYGRYNVSFQVFKNNETGNNCLSLWRKQCLEWCSDKLEGELFADQKYLETWDSYFGDEINEIDHIGLGLAPWNLGKKKITLRKRILYVENDLLILYHYQGLRFVSRSLFNSGLSFYRVKPLFSFIRYVLQPIIKSLLFYQNKSGIDSIGRNLHQKTEGKSLFKMITSYGMFYIIRNTLINIDFIYRLKIERSRIYGLYTKLKNVHR
jgi:hypothetical protein